MENLSRNWLIVKRKLQTTLNIVIKLFHFLLFTFKIKSKFLDGVNIFLWIFITLKLYCELLDGKCVLIKCYVTYESGFGFR